MCNAFLSHLIRILISQIRLQYIVIVKSLMHKKFLCDKLLIGALKNGHFSDSIHPQESLFINISCQTFFTKQVHIYIFGESSLSWLCCFTFFRKKFMIFFLTIVLHFYAFCTQKQKLQPILPLDCLLAYTRIQSLLWDHWLQCMFLAMKMNVAPPIINFGAKPKMLTYRGLQSTLSWSVQFMSQLELR